jgi:hypothetical protein
MFEIKRINMEIFSSFPGIFKPKIESLPGIKNKIKNSHPGSALNKNAQLPHYRAIKIDHHGFMAV